MPGGAFFHYQEARLNTFSGDPVPHHAGLAGSEQMAKLHELAGVERVKLVIGSKSALAIVHQAAFDSSGDGIVEVDLDATLRREALLGAAISQGGGRF